VGTFLRHSVLYRTIILRAVKLSWLEHAYSRPCFNDLVLCYKTKNGLIDTDIDFVVVSNLYTRGHCNKLMKQHCTIDATKIYFSNRVVSIWNSLSEHNVPLPLLLKIVYSSLN